MSFEQRTPNLPVEACFDTVHPVVPAVYSLFALALTMFAFQPAFIGIALIGAICFLCVLGDARQLGRILLWTVPIALVIVVFNPLIAPVGSTVAFSIGTRAVYLEGIVYGLCMAGMLLAVIIEFAGLSQIMSSDKLMALTGRGMPVVSLMVSQVNRMVVRFMRQGRQIESVQSACTAANVAGMRKLPAYGRVVSVLVGWSLEDSLEIADAMRSRGWHRGMKRSSYRRYRFSRRDALALCGIVALGSLCSCIAFMGMQGFAFYPVITPLAFFWGYVPYALFFLLPSVLLAGERL